MSIARLQPQLHRLAQFGANIADAHSCFIFLPADAVQSHGFGLSNINSGHLELGGYHSLSSEVITSCRIDSQTGLIGWVAKHSRSIHVSPFDRDSRTLGVYAADQSLKSFIGIPVKLDQSSVAGVIACDSRKSYAFSKLQGKLLENLAAEVANNVNLINLSSPQSAHEQSFNQFLAKAQAVESALGGNSLLVFRIKLKNFTNLELSLGTAAAFELVEQIFRLVLQTLPPHFPAIKLPNGHLVAVIDNMMSAFYENKVRAMCDYTAVDGHRVEFEFIKEPLIGRDRSLRRLEEVIAASTGVAELAPAKTPLRALFYEFRRA